VDTGSDFWTPLEVIFAQDVPPAVALEQNADKWHRSCYLKYNQTELSRAKKCKAQTDFLDAESTLSSECDQQKTKYTLHARICAEQEAYYFCEQPVSPGTLYMLQHSNLILKFALVLPICRMNTRSQNW